MGLVAVGPREPTSRDIQRLGRLPAVFDGPFLHRDRFVLLPSRPRQCAPGLGSLADRSGLLAGVWGDSRHKNTVNLAAWLALAGVSSVVWWYFTELTGGGDLRPYLLLQGLPIVLIPLWQWIYDAPRSDRLAFSGALLLYVTAKFAELNDHEIVATLGGLTGHTLKHLLASAAVALIIGRLVRRVRAPCDQMIDLPLLSGPVATTI